MEHYSYKADGLLRIITEPVKDPNFQSRNSKWLTFLKYGSQIHTLCALLTSDYVKKMKKIPSNEIKSTLTMSLLAKLT